jgi:hypothetical protein
MFDVRLKTIGIKVSSMKKNKENATESQNKFQGSDHGYHQKLAAKLCKSP